MVKLQSVILTVNNLLFLHSIVFLCGEMQLVPENALIKRL